ncbi:MAG TPA: hypothetical protein PK720_00205 [bacterium]|nr:hypothetical protein [bacterium]
MAKNRYFITPLFLAFISSIAIIGTLIYLTFGLPTILRVVVFLLSLILTFGLKKYFKRPHENEEKIISIPLSKKVRAVSLLYNFFFLLGIFLFFKYQSNRSLLSPWDVLPQLEFIIYGLGTACLFWLLTQTEKKLSPFFLINHYFWTFSAALIIYKIGYGYDPFVHQAAVKAIEELGRIYPTTFYYLGQYSLVTFFHTFFGASISLWDKLLVPLLSAVLLPLTFNHSYPGKSVLKNSILLLLLILPFSLFIVTTPQNLGYLFLVLTIIWSLGLKNRGDEIILWLLALAALTCQPIAGVPAVLLAFSFLIIKIKPTFQKNILQISSFLGYLIILPLAFFLLSQSSITTGFHFHSPDLTSFFSFLLPQNPNKENIWLNLTYFIAAGRGLVFLLLIGKGMSLAYTQKTFNYFRHYGLPALALFLAGIITLTIDFNYLIDYERVDYPERLFWITSLFLLPFIFLTLEDVIIRIKKQTISVQLGLTILITILVTTSFYLSYPRFDHYANSHGYATSEADILAVHWINTNALNKDFIVLANQQVSAASLREFGFKKYYSSMFYYPVPTGGPLYQKYLEMISKPNIEIIQNTRKLTGVQTIYFVLNDYWWAADKLRPELGSIADQEISIADGQITIFVFKN